MADATMIWSADNPTAAPNLTGVPTSYHGLVNRVVNMAQAQGAQVLNKAVVGKSVNLAQSKYTPAQLEEILNQFIEHNLMLTVMIWGPPGVGKSSIVKALAAKHGIGFIDLRLGQLAPTDIRGIPSVTEGGLTRWNPPAHYPQGGRGILFLDEFNQAGAALQGIAQQLILDRRVGDYVVPEGWFIWAAGNRRSHGASVNAMPKPVANRMVHFETVLSIDEWAVWAKNNLASPMVLAYIMASRTSTRGDDSPLLVLDTANEDERFPTPRSWEMAAKLYEAGCPVAPAVGLKQAEGLKVFADRIKGIYDRLVNGETVNITAPEMPQTAWLAVSLGSKSKVSVKNNQADYDKLVVHIKKTLAEEAA